MNIAMVLAGGTGTRIGADIPKQFIRVMGKPVLAYTLEIFQACDKIHAIEIVCHKDWINEVRNIVDEYAIKKTRWLATGGATFQESVMNGVFALRGKVADNDIVVVSFGVSPMTPMEDINDSIRICEKHGNGIAAKDIDLCTCIKDDECGTTQNLIRETIKGFGNPWTFRFGELYQGPTSSPIEKVFYRNWSPIRLPYIWHLASAFGSLNPLRLVQKSPRGKTLTFLKDTFF